MADESEMRHLIGSTVNLIPAGAVMRGDLEADGGHRLRIDGMFSGRILLRGGGHLVIGPGAEVASDSVDVDSIVIFGKFTGAVRARRIELGSTARIAGKLQYTEGFACQPGARIHAQLEGPEGVPE